MEVLALSVANEMHAKRVALSDVPQLLRLQKDEAQRQQLEELEVNTKKTEVHKLIMNYMVREGSISLDAFW